MITRGGRGIITKRVVHKIANGVMVKAILPLTCIY